LLFPDPPQSCGAVKIAAQKRANAQKHLVVPSVACRTSVEPVDDRHAQVVLTLEVRGAPRPELIIRLVQFPWRERPELADREVVGQHEALVLRNDKVVEVALAALEGGHGTGHNDRGHIWINVAPRAASHAP
jgi:hypothetical protein